MAATDLTRIEIEWIEDHKTYSVHIDSPDHYNAMVFVEKLRDLVDNVWVNRFRLGKITEVDSQRYPQAKKPAQ